MKKEPIIEFEKLTKRYGDTIAVDQLTLSVYRGEIFGLLGPNGAGKTTTILMLLGLSEPSAGKIKVCGIDPTFQPLLVKDKVGYLPDEVGFYEIGVVSTISRFGVLNRIDAPRPRKERDLEQEGPKSAQSKPIPGHKQRLGLADI